MALASLAITALASPDEEDTPDDGQALLRAIYTEHFDYVWHAVRRLGGRERDLEDLVHDVFMAAWRSLDRYDRSRPIKPWLYGVAFRVVSDYRRRASFRREIATEGHEVADRRPGALEAVAAREARETVQAALESLDLDQRAVFVMVEIEGLTMPEVAQAMPASINTLYSRLRLARKRFADAVRRRRAEGRPGDTS